MGLESGSYISALVATNPVGATDPKSQGDDHLRFIKAKILETFPNITGEVTATHTELNLIASVNSLARFAAAGGTDTITVSYTNSVRLVDGVEFLVRAAGANTITNPVFDPIGVAATVTMTIASPCVVTHTAHGRYEAEPVVFTTSDTLPTGLTAGTTYYIKSPTTNTYNVAATPGGTAIDTSGSQAGTHTATVGKHTLYKHGGSALVAGDIVGAGHEVTIRFRQNPARYELLDAGYLSSSGGTLAGVLNLKTGTLISISASLSGTTAALNLTSATGNGLHIAGTLTVSTVTLGSGMFRTVIFDGDAKLLHHATKLNLPGEANLTTAAGDRATFWSDGTTVYCIDYTKANGGAIGGFASTEEIKTGTEAAKQIAPDKLLAAIGFSAYYQSTDQTITAGGALTLAHGLGREPIMVKAFLKNVTAEYGYTTGMIVPISFLDDNNNIGITAVLDSTNINIRFGSFANVFRILHYTTGASNTITLANWTLVIRAWA